MSAPEKLTEQYILTDEILQSAIEEAVNWEKQMTGEERTTVVYSEARIRVSERIFEKYKAKIINQ